MNTKIKLCLAKEIITLRHVVLRQGKPISSCHFDGDDYENTYHFGAFNEDKVIGCVSLIKKDHQNFNYKNTYQLRGMAVLPYYRNKKIGLQILTHAANFLKKKNIELIWCNVRIRAIPFYRKNNFLSKGTEFNIPDVGPHVLMFKALYNA